MNCPNFNLPLFIALIYQGVGLNLFQDEGGEGETKNEKLTIYLKKRKLIFSFLDLLEKMLQTSLHPLTCINFTFDYIYSL